MSRFKTHSPERVGVMIHKGLDGNQFDLMDVISDITLDEFRVYMVSKGCTQPIDNVEIEAAIGCTPEQAKAIYSLFCERVKYMTDHGLRD